MKKLELERDSHYTIDGTPAYEFARKLREKEDPIQGRWATRHGIHRNAVQTFESGRNHSFKLMVKILRALGYEVKLFVSKIK